MRGQLTREMFACIPELDFNSGNRYFLGNMVNYSKALMSTLKSIKSKLLILEAMNNTEEYEGLRILTQTLRRMLSNIGAVGMTEMTSQLETAVLNNNLPAVKDQFREYVNSLCEFSEHLETLLKKIDAKNEGNTNEVSSSFLNYNFTKTKDSIRRSSDLLERKII